MRGRVENLKLICRVLLNRIVNVVGRGVAVRTIVDPDFGTAVIKAFGV
ncbi:hypothetical protein SAMN05444167_1123 [Terriglobus roseus]|uniref:Uncharacterized protein n=1 Tax=Terriglobus roseus TaxID=392734 RepID=A0A1G7HLE4_9BACT|nr:hypothetical protein SAMN05444167_1123 [Terriglobus roseus]